MKIFPLYNHKEHIAIFDEEGNQLMSIPSLAKTKIYDTDGNNLSKLTLKIPLKKGFASGDNSEKINLGGRPGMKKTSKDTFKDAVKLFKTNRLVAAQLIVNVMEGNAKALGCDIKASDRFSAAKYVITAPDLMEKQNGGFGDFPIDKPSGKSENKVVPLIQLTVQDKK